MSTVHSDLCRSLTKLAGGEESDSALGRLLLDWKEEADAQGVAVFLPSKGGWELIAWVGPKPRPESVDDPDAGLTRGRVRILPTPRDRRTDNAELDALVLVAARLVELERQLAREHFQARYRGVELEALYDVGLAITATLDLDQLGEEILFRAVSLLDARRGALWGLDGDRYRLSSSIGGDARDLISAAELEAASEPTTEGPSSLLPGARFLLTAPVEVEGQPRGLLALADKESRTGVGDFGESDRRTLSLFANQAAIALENARLHREALEKERLVREMELAAQIQQQILPTRLPILAGWEIEAWSRPARQIGGDYFQLVTEKGRLTATLGDVTGKGMPAALMVSNLHSALQLLGDTHSDPEELARRLNTHLFELSAANKFVTLIWAQLDPASGGLRWLNAGHNPAVLVRADGKIEHFAASGIPMGLMRGGSWTACEAQLHPGDLLCLYSDGITEAADDDDEEFGLDRLEGHLSAHRGTSLRDLRRSLDDSVRAFSGDQPQGDDQTVVLLRRELAAG